MRTNASRFRRISVPLHLMILFGIVQPFAMAQKAPPAILGNWRGTSICTDLKVAPACKDEKVIYHFVRPDKSAPNKITVRADKVVNGEVLPMGDMEFSYDAKNDQWSCELKTSKVHAVWSFAVKGNRLTGTLTDIPTKTIIRRVSAQKE